MTRSEFEDFLMENQKDIYKFCFYLTRNREDADDLYQDTWAAVIPRLMTIDVNNNPKSYIMGQVAIKWRDKNKKLQRRNSIAPIIDALNDRDIVQDTKNLEDYVISKELEKVIRSEIINLKATLRIVVELYYSMEMSTKEIAEVLKIPKGTVESRLFVARKTIKKRLEKLGYESI